MTDIEKFEKHQQELMDSFRAKMTNIANDVLRELYTDVTYYADADANINYRNHLRDEITHVFKKEIAEEYGQYSWAYDMRTELLKHHREQISNKIIEDLQEKIKSLEDRIEQMRELRI